MPNLDACYCSDRMSGGVPCPPGKCPNVPIAAEEHPADKERRVALKQVLRAELARGTETTGHDEYGPVNHPTHYNLHPAGIECIEVIEDFSSNIASAIKYLWRAGLKPGAEHDQDLAKAVWYIERERERVKRRQEQLAVKLDRQVRKENGGGR